MTLSVRSSLLDKGKASQLNTGRTAFEESRVSVDNNSGGWRFTPSTKVTCCVRDIAALSHSAANSEVNYLAKDFRDQNRRGSLLKTDVEPTSTQVDLLQVVV